MVLIGSKFEKRASVFDKMRDDVNNNANERTDGRATVDGGGDDDDAGSKQWQCGAPPVGTPETLLYGYIGKHNSFEKT